MASHAPNWPGEWDPSQHDVALASEVPDPSLLVDFKRALFANDESQSNQPLMQLNLSDDQAEDKYTYPLVLLSEFPSMPDHVELTRLRLAFPTTYNGQLLLGSLSVPPASREQIAPHLLFAMACMAAVAEDKPGRPRELFSAAISLWSVMMEIDNRETRTEEALVAGVLLSMYSAVDSDPKVWRWARMILYGTSTIARRRRLHKSCLFEDRPSFSAHSPTICALWLADLLQAIHMDAPMNLSTQEMAIRMPHSLHKLRHIYSLVLQNASLPTNMQHIEDSILLLVALLSDAIYLHRSLARLADRPKQGNPFVPLSPFSEHERMYDILSRAFNRWHTTFSAPQSVMALYHYSRLYLSFPEVTTLAHHAGYPSGRVSDLKTTVPEQTLKHAWAILDTAAASDNKGGKICPVWLPVTIFHAGLVVWAKLHSDEAYGSPRIMLSFVVELQKMRWPCCSKMASTLQALMLEPGV